MRSGVEARTNAEAPRFHFTATAPRFCAIALSFRVQFDGLSVISPIAGSGWPRP